MGLRRRVRIAGGLSGAVAKHLPYDGRGLIEFQNPMLDVPHD